ncbi:MAG: hypothetical protein WA154_05185, partial [Moraxellaceae bacterium]
MWQDMITSDIRLIVFYFSLCIAFGCMSSLYYQNLIGAKTNYTLVFSSSVGAIFFFLGSLATFWWS